MSLHFADCLYGDSVAEGDGGSEGMPCHVVGQVLCYLGLLPVVDNPDRAVWMALWLRIAS